MTSCFLLLFGLMALEVEATSVLTEVSPIMANGTGIKKNDGGLADGGDYKMDAADSADGQVMVMDEDILSMSNRSINTELDVARIFVGLFDADEAEEEFFQNTQELPSNRGGRASSSEGKETADVSRYNRYVDSIFERMNTMLKVRQMDPLSMNLLGRRRKGYDNQQKRKNRGKKRRGGKNRRNQGKRKTAQEQQLRITRDISLLPSVEPSRTTDSSQDEMTATKSGDVEMEQDDSEARKGERETFDNKDRQRSKSRGQNWRRGGNKNRKKEKGNKKDSRKGQMTMKGVLTGLATIRRTGNVNVKQRLGPKVVLVRFQIGPVELQITKKQFRNGKRPKVQKASASAEQLEGRLNIRINDNDTAKVKKLRVLRPKEVTVKGSLSPQDKSRSKGSTQKFVRNGYRKMAPEVTSRLHSVARNVLNSEKRTDHHD